MLFADHFTALYVTYKSIRLCVGYHLDGQRLDVLPRGAESVARCEPIYEDFPGWKGTTYGIREWDKLPPQAQAFLRRIESRCGQTNCNGFYRAGAR